MSRDTKLQMNGITCQSQCSGGNILSCGLSLQLLCLRSERSMGDLYGELQQQNVPMIYGSIRGVATAKRSPDVCQTSQFGCCGDVLLWFENTKTMFSHKRQKYHVLLRETT